MTARTRWAASVVIAAVGAACSVSAPVAVERSDQTGDGPVIPDGRAGLPPIGASSDPAQDTDLPVVATPASSIEWGDCVEFGIPPTGQLGTSGWECGTLSTAMDPFAERTAGEAGVGDTTVELALTRHAATGDRRGAIVVNPGGPGGEGLPTAWNLRGGMPADLLRSFDIVSWDPRGIGRSIPTIDCDDDVAPDDGGFIAACVEATGPLAGFLTAPYSAADMESIRIALGEDTLNYLGYSYGSVLGATYAAEHPDRVGAFVLDGVTDPLAGSADGPFEDGFAVLADDGTQAALDRFAALCDATDRCLFSLDATTVIEDLAVQVPALSTSDFSGGPDRIDTASYEQLLESSMTYAGDWELLATGLEDADRGDASSLAALIAREGARDDDASTDDEERTEPDEDGDGDPDDDDDDGDGDGDGDDDGNGQSDFAEANFLIYCSDLGPWITEWSFCDGIPASAKPMQAVRPVEVEREILVIGTEYDPLTPGHHAPEFAAALGDSVHVIWEGVGHTAFPGWTPCIDRVVSDQFLRRPLPEDGRRCSFLAQIDDDAALGDELFGHGDIESANLLEYTLSTRDGEPDAACVADAVNESTDRVITHVVLDVESDAAGSVLDDALGSC